MSKQILSPFEDLRYCPICKQEFVEPRLIPCGHSFCLRCIKPLQNRHVHNQRILICPECSKVCTIPKAGVDDFPHVYAVKQLKTAFEEVNHILKHIQCGVCEKRVDQPICCQKCVEYFCDHCASLHRSLFPDHVLESTAENPSVTKCTSHFNQLMTHYCTRCLEAVCPLCATRNHANKESHSVMPLEEAKSHFVTLTDRKIRKFEESRERIMVALDATEQDLRNEEHKYCLEKRKIEEAAERSRSLVSEEEELLLSDLKYRYDHNTKCFENEQHNKQSTLQAMDDSISSAKESLSSLKNDSLLKPGTGAIKTALTVLDMVSADAVTAALDLELKEYFFQPSGLQRFVGIIDPELPTPDNRIDQLKSLPFADEIAENEDEISGGSHSSQTRIKEIFKCTPQLVDEHLVTSAVDGTIISMIGIGLATDGAVLCAFNVPGLSQVIISQSSELQHVIYHRRKGISAFAVSASGKCGVALKEDDNLYLLSPDDLHDEREATCQTHKHSYGKSKPSIQAIAFNREEQIIISDGEKNTITGFDAQWRRPFNISGNAKGEFCNAASVTVGSAGEIIIFDNMKKNLVIFNKDTRYRKSISLDKLSNSCTIASHFSGVVFVADRKTSCVYKVDIDHGNIDEVLNAESGIESPSCIAVRGELMAISNKESFSNAKIKLYRIT
ncbi:tripartite motif-containing protein 2-like [Gigantopelta aegis]|uniref:tripartite motif-containing protein 2-like n=1 Tax=Gigantopelta aegis TaxID=1735272 RepID=UPI001B88A244|nr:tripartite motif-containing protein 2-like [Gigantopelta aegis]